MLKKVPNHLGIILDGNRRWAKEKGLPALAGHRKGMEKVKKLTSWAKKRGVKILTLFVFSTENWNRSRKEVNYLMKLLGQSLGNPHFKKLNKEGIRIQVIGQRNKLPKSLQKAIKNIEELTKKNKKMILNFALSSKILLPTASPRPKSFWQAKEEILLKISPVSFAMPNEPSSIPSSTSSEVFPQKAISKS